MATLNRNEELNHHHEDDRELGKEMVARLIGRTWTCFHALFLNSSLGDETRGQDCAHR